MKEQQLQSFFLACDCKPGTQFFKSMIDPFAYDIEPAYLHGSLGLTHYDPESYSIIDLFPATDPLLGYLMTISHPDTIDLLDRVKGVYSPEGFNFHNRVLVNVITKSGETKEAWAYVLSDKVLDCYESIVQIEFGLWDEDEQLVEMLDVIEERERTDERTDEID